MPFDLRQLRYALAAAKLGSYGFAARACEVSEETIGEGVAALDAMIGSKLFEPSGNGIIPTAVGARFLHAADFLLRRAEEIASFVATSPLDDIASEAVAELGGPAGIPCSCPLDGASGEIAGPGAGEGHAGVLAGYVELCRAILAARQLMGRAFGSDLFADPAGEMLLDLYVRENDGIATSISKIWNASNAAYGTARRSLAIMERRGLIARMPDTKDGRRTLVLLTDLARIQLEACLDIILDSRTRGEDRPKDSLRRLTR